MATQQIQNDPVYSLPHLYIAGISLSVASTTVIALSPGAARDSMNNIDMEIGYANLQGNVLPATQVLNYIPPFFVNSAVTGAGGLDAGTLAASTQYAVYLIGDSRGYMPTAGILSLSSNAYPLLPLGYDSLRLMGFAGTNGSTAFTAAGILNAANLKSFYLSPAVSVLSGGNATTFTAIDLSTPIPTTTDTNVIAFLQVTFTPANVGDTVQFRPTGSTATAGLTTIVGTTAGVAQTQFQQIVCGVGASKPEIDYKVTASGDSVTVLVAGYSFTTT